MVEIWLNLKLRMVDHLRKLGLEFWDGTFLQIPSNPSLPKAFEFMGSGIPDPKSFFNRIPPSS